MVIEDVFTTDGDTGLLVAGSLVVVKDTTGNPSSPQEGEVVANTIDKTLNLYVSAAWVTLGTW